MKDHIALVGLIFLAFVACGWAWLIATDGDDDAELIAIDKWQRKALREAERNSKYGSEPDDDWELAEIDAAITENMRKGLADEQARLGYYDLRGAGNSGSGRVLDDSDGMNDDGPETA